MTVHNLFILAWQLTRILAWQLTRFHLSLATHSQLPYDYAFAKHRYLFEHKSVLGSSCITR